MTPKSVKNHGARLRLDYVRWLHKKRL